MNALVCDCIPAFVALCVCVFLCEYSTQSEDLCTHWFVFVFLCLWYCDFVCLYVNIPCKVGFRAHVGLCVFSCVYLYCVFVALPFSFSVCVCVRARRCACVPACLFFYFVHTCTYRWQRHGECIRKQRGSQGAACVAP